MKIITIAKHKGGVGASTLAWALSSIWAQTKTVLVWDFDPQQTLTMALGADHAVNGYDVLTGQIHINEGISNATSAYPPNLKMIGSTGMMARLDSETASNFDRHHLVSDVVEKIEDKFDLLVIDTPPSEGSILTIGPMVACDYVLIPCSCDDASYQQTPRLQQTVAHIKKRLNPRIKELPIVTNLFDQRLTMDRQVLAALKKNYSTLNTVVPKRTSIREEMAAGLPCTNPELIALANEIMELIND